jgi:anti-sigma28 factor (negative regulator of flagellin synthesis)
MEFSLSDVVRGFPEEVKDDEEPDQDRLKELENIRQQIKSGTFHIPLEKVADDLLRRILDESTSGPEEPNKNQTN